MKKIVTYTGGHPINVDDLDHLGEATAELNEDIARALTALGIGNGILWGCTFSGSGTISWTAGAVMYSGEIYRVAAGSAGGTMSSLKLVLNTTYRANNPVPYFDGNNRNVHQINAATFAASGSLPTMETLDERRFGNLLSDRIAQHNPFIEVEDADLLNSWVNAESTSKFSYRKVGGKLELSGKIQTGALGSIVYQLPAGYRPAATRVQAVMNIDGSTLGHLLLNIQTNGDIVVGQSGTTGIVHLEGVSVKL